MTKLDLERFAEFNDSYEFVDHLYDEASTIPIRLTDKKYYGTILKYDTIISALSESAPNVVIVTTFSPKDAEKF